MVPASRRCCCRCRCRVVLLPLLHAMDLLFPLHGSESHHGVLTHGYLVTRILLSPRRCCCLRRGCPYRPLPRIAPPLRLAPSLGAAEKRREEKEAMRSCTGAAMVRGGPLTAGGEGGGEAHCCSEFGRWWPALGGLRRASRGLGVGVEGTFLGGGVTSSSTCAHPHRAHRPVSTGGKLCHRVVLVPRPR